jgi:hypothetical protein
MNMTNGEYNELKRQTRRLMHAYQDHIIMEGITFTQYPKTPVNKGIFGKNCNREACQKSGATWWNTSTRLWYCTECAYLINEANLDDCIMHNEYPFLCISPLDTERYPH